MSKRCEFGHLADESLKNCPTCETDGFFPEEASIIDGKYVVERELGRGAMGIVYLARDIGLGRKVAVKVIGNAYARDTIMVDRFKREAQALAAVKSEHVVQIYALGSYGPFPYFAMEFVAGKSLESIIDDHSAHRAFVPLRLALSIVRAVGLGLSAVHRARLVHRDVKPQNVVIEEDSGRPVLIDFGLVRRVEEGDLRRTAAAGTPLYMAPEQHSQGREVEAHVITARTDLYALASAGFELLTGRPPFVASSAAELRRIQATGSPPRLSDKRPELSPLDPVFAKALAHDPDARYQDCPSFLDAFVRASGDVLVAAGVLTPEELADERGAPDLAPAPVSSPGEAETILPPSSIEARLASGMASEDEVRDAALRILIIDDDPQFRRFASAAAQVAFQDAPHEIFMAASGPEGLNVFAAAHPDMVLLDFDMPQLDGIGTLSALRLLPHGYETKVLVISASIRTEQRWRFSVLGVRDFLDKPVALDGLARSLRDIADRSEWRVRAAAALAAAAG